MSDSATAVQTSLSRERLASALNHKQPDRIPIDFGGSSVTGIHASCVAALRDYYGLEKRPVRIHEPSQMLGQVDDDLKDALGVDVVGRLPARHQVGCSSGAMEAVAVQRTRSAGAWGNSTPRWMLTATRWSIPRAIRQPFRPADACRRTAISSIASFARSRSTRSISIPKTTWWTFSLISQADRRLP
jgi:hypothetical protein